MSDLLYLALTLLSFAGLALLVGRLAAHLEPDPLSGPGGDDADDADDADGGGTSATGGGTGRPTTAARR